MGDGAHLVDANLAYASYVCPIGDFDSPLEGGADSVVELLRGLPLGSVSDPRGNHGGLSSSSTNAQGEATVKMVKQLNTLLSEVHALPFSLHSFTCLFVDHSKLDVGLLGRKLMTWQPRSWQTGLSWRRRSKKDANVSKTAFKRWKVERAELEVLSEKKKELEILLEQAEGYSDSLFGDLKILESEVFDLNDELRRACERRLEMTSHHAF